MSSSLFGSLAFRFSASPELLATEALGYILDHSEHVTRAMGTLLRSFLPDAEDDLHFRTQVTGEDDRAVPDLIGFDSDDTPVCILEGKFWAGLTAHQPVTYLQRLPPGRAAALLFVAPRLRLPTLWGDLLERLRHQGMEAEERRSPVSGSRFARITSHHALILLSWDQLLEYLSDVALQAGDLTTRDDLRQLKGLCDKIDTEAFIPLRSEELTPYMAKRYMDFVQLVDELARLGKERGWFNTRGLRAAGNRMGYSQYLHFGNIQIALSFSPPFWFSLANTPLWMQIYGEEWNNPDETKKMKVLLNPLKQHHPPRLFDLPSQPALVPLFLTPETEKEKLLKNLMEQIERTGQLIRVL